MGGRRTIILRSSAGCLHFAVNHSEHYVDPETGAHTQTVEGLWRQVKAFLPNFG